MLLGTGSINGTGNALPNLLTGNGSNNTLSGGGRDDLLNGLGGADVLIGGAGHDTFDIDPEGPQHNVFSRDEIRDFTKGDQIDLSTIDANWTVSGDQKFTFVQTFNTSNAAGQLRFDAAHHLLLGSTDRDITPEFSILISGVSKMTSFDFVL